MGCGASSRNDGVIRMNKTKLAGVDEFFDDVQSVADEIYNIKDPIDTNKEMFLYHTDIWKLECGNTHHGVVGLVFSLASKSAESDLGNLFKVVPQSPFVEINKNGAASDDAKAIGYFEEYVKALVSAKDKIGPLAEKVKTLAEKAPDMPDKAKSEMENSGSMGAMDKMNAVRYTATNCKMLATMPGLIKELQQTVTDSLAEVQGAGKELQGKSSNMSETRKKCIDAKCSSAKDCYLTAGDKIDTSPEKVKEWKAKSKKGRKGKAVKAKK